MNNAMETHIGYKQLTLMSHYINPQLNSSSSSLKNSVQPESRKR